MSNQEERLTAYLTLIQALLNCNNGEEIAELLSEYPQLIDLPFLLTIHAVAEQIEDETQANWLNNIAEGLFQSLFQQRESLLGQLLQATAESNGDAAVVYPLLQQNLEQIDELLMYTLQNRWETNSPNLGVEEKQGIAEVIFSFSNLMQQFPFNRPLAKP